MVLREEEQPVLGLARVERVGDVTLEARDISHQEGRQARPAAAGALCARGVEIQFARTVAVARDAQVVCAADVGTKLEGVVALNLGPVVHELILVFILDQRAIAAIDAQRVPEAGTDCSAVSVDEEGGHAGVEVVVHVHARNTGVLRRRRADSVWLAEYVVANIPKAEIGEQSWLDGVIEAARDGVIA